MKEDCKSVIRRFESDLGLTPQQQNNPSKSVDSAPFPPASAETAQTPELPDTPRTYPLSGYGGVVAVEWAPIPGYSKYEASNTGSIRNSRTLNPVAQSPNRKGYQQVKLFADDGRAHTVRVGRAVLLAFRGVPLDGMHAAHEDGSRADNRLDNLAWKTGVENEADKVRHGTAAVGERNGKARLSADKVRAIKDRLIAGESDRSIAVCHDVSENTINDIRRGVTWKHVGPPSAGKHGRSGRPHSVSPSLPTQRFTATAGKGTA